MIVDNKKAQKRKRGYQNIILSVHYAHYLNQFKKWQQQLGYAEKSMVTNYRKLSHFFKYLQKEQIKSIYQVKQAHIINYNQELHQQNISRSYILGKLNIIKSFSLYLEKTENYKITFKELHVEKTLSKERIILTPKEVGLLFASLEDTATGLRDKALLHLCYSCGLRSSEAVRIRCKDIDYHKQLLYVAPGKNYHSRYIPISSSVAKELQCYKQYARPVLNPNGKAFLVSPFTDQMSTQTLARYLKKLLEKTPITKHITAHCLRHSIATHLLVKGMDLENIGQFLGHKSLDATQIYIRMSNEYIND